MRHFINTYTVTKRSDVHKLQCFCRCVFKSLNTCQNVSTKKQKERPNICLQNTYHPEAVESQLYDWWESKNYFKPMSESDSFAILLPPPNVTGTLHLGHALTLTIQDALLRWRRMKGESVVWIPGVDHAGIATQSVVEKHLNESLGLSRHSLGKDEFLKRVEEWKNEKAKIIVEQLRKMGASLDWSKLIYTMDPVHSQLVTNSFIRLYKDGLIYRKRDFVNWSCALKSSVSDIEVNFLKIKKRTKLSLPGYEKPVDFGVLYEFAYKVCEEDDEIVVSTTRPETMLGDAAVAVHPNDTTHSRFINKLVWHPFRNEKIPVIADPFVNPKFATGAVKITPAHSIVDHQVGLKHHLKAIEVINEEGLTNNVGDNKSFHGKKRFLVRDLILDELSRLGLLRGYKEHDLSLPVCSRSGDVIEPMLKSQWFLNCKSLARKAVEVVENGELRLEPKSYDNVWIDWLKTKAGRDWNLSRQLWWGHQIPMYRCVYLGKEEWVASGSPEDAKAKAAEMFGASGDDVEVSQDSDVLDTWFSSGLLPLNPLVGRGRKPPISVMVTGHDIIFFWVARMVMLSIHLTGSLPFRNVFLHSLVCDARGKKMSKSIGNVVLPEDIIKGVSLNEMKQKLANDLEQGHISQKQFNSAVGLKQKMFPNGIPECGVDGLRFTLSSNCIRGSFINFDVDLCRSSRFFCNKIYQAVKYLNIVARKYVKVNTKFDLAEIPMEREAFNYFDKWILSRLSETVKSVDESFASFTFSVGTAAIRTFVVEDFCSNYLESSKQILEDASPLQYRTTISVLFHCLETSLRLLSPFMPFITEHLYHSLPALNGFHPHESITLAPFPNPAHWTDCRDLQLESNFSRISNLLTVLRRAKTLLHLKEVNPNAYVVCPDEVAEILFGDMEIVFRKLGRVGEIVRVENLQKWNVLRQAVDKDCTVYVEHPHDKATLTKLLGSEIGREKKLKENIEKLQLELEACESKNLSTRELHQVNKMKELEADLDRIEELKHAIDRCSV